jgi:hydrogenase maturation protease
VHAERTSAHVVVGGVAHLYQGDLDLGRHAVERLLLEDLGPDVLVEEFSYGAVAVTQRLEDLRPAMLVLVGAKRRGRPPGTVDRWDAIALPRTPAETQESVADAVTGYIDLDLVLDVAQGLGALPPRTVVVDVEPATTDPATELSPEATDALEQALELIREELRRAGASA